MKKLLSFGFLSLFFVLLFGTQQLPEAQAHHSWSNYHWARTSNPFKVTIGDNVSAQWKPFMLGASYYWGRSSVLDVPVVHGGIDPSKCRAQTARVQVCNYSYGETGWMGLAQLWVTGDHITAATVKVNDTYFNKSRFNTNGWRNLVMCQEVGHAFGLSHQDEDFSNAPLGTCMDHSNNPDPNQWPNLHDYYQLLSIYRHADTRIADEITLAVDETSLAGESDLNDPSEWGEQVSGGTTLAGAGDHVASYERDFGNGRKLRTVVIHAAL